ncbi:hypothetical protein [Streptomyces sp. NPDC088910]|uniref:hypothetical protein n=1 Tax=Streptomyces sp. NPDC088910 TaxID=3365911 RepID=UPI0037F59AB2
MRDVVLDRTQEGVFWCPVEELHLDDVKALRNGRQETVHAVNHLHAHPMHHDRRERFLHFHQPVEVLLVDPPQAW